MKHVLIFSLLLFVTGCNGKHENSESDAGGSYYTCPMHPSVWSNSPGVCPVCNMSLIKVERGENNHAGHEGNFVTLDKRQQLLAGIETDTAALKTIIPTSAILGTVAIDEEQVSTLSSRVKGRIDKLHIKATGAYLRKGSPVYAIYSEELFAGEKEFLALSAKKQNSNTANKLLDDMLLASKNKLLLWGLTENQIAALEQNKTASLQTTFHAPVEGYVTEVMVKEGMYVEEGMPILTSAGLKQVWVEAQLYANEKSKGGSSFRIFTETSPDEIFEGHLVFNNPSIEEGRKIQLLRLRVDNTKNKLIPGMMVYVHPKGATKRVLSIPKSAVLSEKMKTVWVLAHDNTFEQRMVETGAENKDQVEILSGIKEGEIIVTSGAYLINSELILKSGAGQRHEH